MKNSRFSTLSTRLHSFTGIALICLFILFSNTSFAQNGSGGGGNGYPWYCDTMVAASYNRMTIGKTVMSQGGYAKIPIRIDIKQKIKTIDMQIWLNNSDNIRISNSFDFSWHYFCDPYPIVEQWNNDGFLHFALVAQDSLFGFLEGYIEIQVQSNAQAGQNFSIFGNCNFNDNIFPEVQNGNALVWHAVDYGNITGGVHSPMDAARILDYAIDSNGTTSDTTALLIMDVDGSKSFSQNPITSFDARLELKNGVDPYFSFPVETGCWKCYWYLSPPSTNTGDGKVLMTQVNTDVLLSFTDDSIFNGDFVLKIPPGSYIETGSALYGIYNKMKIVGDSIVFKFFNTQPLSNEPFLKIVGAVASQVHFNATVNRGDKVEAEVVMGVQNGANTVPTKFALSQNYPNPFNPTTSISYSIPQNSFVSLKVFDVLGQEVATLVNEEKSVGNYDVSFDASGIPSGMYFYRLQAGSFIDTKKMVLMK